MTAPGPPRLAHDRSNPALAILWVFGGLAFVIGVVSTGQSSAAPGGYVALLLGGIAIIAALTVHALRRLG